MNRLTSADKIAALANVKSYNHDKMCKYINGAPHVKHAELRSLYRKLVLEVYDAASYVVSQPKVLDIGAGEGSATLPFLELGAKVSVVDISETQLDTLKKQCSSFSDNLTIYCADINSTIQEFLGEKRQYDIIVMNSFLHHIPDYLSLIKQCSNILSSHGQFFTFQDPLRYASLSKFTNIFSRIAYLSWRMFKGDVIGGIQRRFRRNINIFLDDCPHDNSDYHVVRSGVDQDAIAELFTELGFKCQIIPYFSTQSRCWQFIGAAMKLHNTFSIIAKKNSV